MALYGGIKLPGQPDYENIRKLDQMPVRCVMEMMHRGFAIDKEYLRDISDYLGSCMSEMRKDICSYIPPDKLDEFIGKDDDEMNVDSNQQLGDLLFDILKIGDGRELKRTKSGDRLSTGKKQLEVLKREHPIIQKILIYREHAKLKSTYADSLPNKSVWHPQGLCWCGERHIAGTWRIHTTILGTRTSTGRYASKNPNLQNISTRTELGRLIRAAFIATPGMVLVGCDWSQQEMRFGGHYSQDSNLLRIFREGLDPHTDTAKRAFKKTEYEVTNKEGKFLYRDPCKCFHPDTEVLTKNGWCKIVNLGIEEEVAQAIPGKDMSVGLSWVKPTYVGSKDNHYDHMLHLRSEGIDLIVTPDHRMLGWLDSGRYVVDIPDSMLRRCRYWANAGIMEGGIGVDLNILKIAVAVQADGNVTKDGLIRLGFTKQRKKERILRLLDGSGLSYYKAEYRNGTLSILIHKKSAKVVLGLLDADKTLPWNWLGLSAEARGVVLEEAEFWDSWSGPKSYRYTSAHKKNVDVLQAIAAITGRKTRVVEDSSNSRKNNSHSILYNLTVRSNCISRTGNVAVEKVAYAGKVACLSVPSSFVLVRYGGVVTVCGQSVNFGVFYGLAAPGLYDLMAITYATAGIPLPDWLTVSWCEDFINQWFELYPGVREYLNEQEYRAFRYGMVWTLFGRVREVPEAKSCHKRVVTAGIRQAGNLPIQGSGADLMRLVLPEVHDYILGQLRPVNVNVWPLLTVHDEGIWEIEEDYAEMFKDYLEYTFGNVMVDKDTGVNLCRVPIKAEAKIMERWQK